MKLIFNVLTQDAAFVMGLDTIPMHAMIAMWYWVLENILLRSQSGNPFNLLTWLPDTKFRLKQKYPILSEVWLVDICLSGNIFEILLDHKVPVELVKTEFPSSDIIVAHKLKLISASLLKLF